MADTTLTGNQFAAHAKTLVANTAEAVTFPGYHSEVEVVSDGAAAIYVRVDGSAPTVGGANSFVLPAQPCKRVIRMPSDVQNTVVKLISAGTPTYSVTGL